MRIEQDQSVRGGPGGRCRPGQQQRQDATQQVKKIVGRRKGEIKHLMADKAGHSDDYQNETAQDDVGFRECWQHREMGWAG